MLLRVALIVSVASLASCKSNTPVETQPAAGQAASSTLTLLAPESREWTKAEALAALSDVSLASSAAVRLVELSDYTPACIPAELSDDLIRKLRVLPIGTFGWLLGIGDEDDMRLVRAPALIDVTGGLGPFDGELDEELLAVRVSDDTDIYPHVVLLPDRVLLLEEVLVPALAMSNREHVRFAFRYRNGFPYVGLVLLSDANAEVALYRWDPYELMFLGPAADKLPEPPGGHFALDLETSTRLVPVGGQMPEPDPIQPPVDPNQVPDWTRPRGLELT